MKVTYVGNTFKEDIYGNKVVDTESGRFAVIYCKAKENSMAAQSRVNKMIDLGYDSPDEFGDPEESSYWFNIEDHEEYQQFMKDWKSTKHA